MVQVVCNSTVLWNQPLTAPRSLQMDLDLLDTIDIAIVMSDKIYSSVLETAVVIDRIAIDGFDLVPGFVHFAHYDNDQQMATVGNYLGFNGTWRYVIDVPFYRWHHQITGQGWLLEPKAKSPY